MESKVRDMDYYRDDTITARSATAMPFQAAVSISPGLVPDGQAIQHFPVERPFGHEKIHDRDETPVVSGLDQMGHFVHHDVFQAFPRFPGQIGIQPDACGAGAAATPFGFHLLHKEPLHLDMHERLPFRNQWRDCCFDLRAIPLVENGLLLLFSHFRARLKKDLVVLQLYLRRCIFVDDLEQIALSPDIMAFAVQILARRFTLLLTDVFRCCLIQPSLEIANTRMVSTFIRRGAEIRTLPAGGCTLRWTFLISFFTTSTAISPSSIFVTISIPSAA